ncbi:hypothetical protein QCE63_17840 [Caballeronia sp. LZ065]|uniref:hypothetical protein n=1 Tax=Caballeronia sp. LZ065 TaxID=3038571 RepID=UPI002857BC45|nr:hypothetical protein [Caballeronia sp. LZ065]MDR5781266.1 hypothetical protein [Caballeronia sp. LZ065]
MIEELRRPVLEFDSPCVQKLKLLLGSLELHAVFARGKQALVTSIGQPPALRDLSLDEGDFFLFG